MRRLLVLMAMLFAWPLIGAEPIGYQIMIKVPTAAAPDSARADSILKALSNVNDRVGNISISNREFTIVGYVARLPQDSLYAMDTLVLRAYKAIPYYGNVEILVSRISAVE